MIPIKETFLSIQGEGFYAGQSAYFIRTQGCDIGCHWCDEPESWKLSREKERTSVSVASDLIKTNTKIVIFTGGEPLMHDLTEFSTTLTKKGYQLHLETSGGYPLTGKWDWITLSPKKNKLPLPHIYKKSNELKCIIYNQSDFDFAIQESKKVSENCLLYLQPEWGKKNEMIEEIINFMKVQEFKLEFYHKTNK